MRCGKVERTDRARTKRLVPLSTVFQIQPPPPFRPSYSDCPLLPNNTHGKLVSPTAMCVRGGGGGGGLAECQRMSSDSRG